MQSLQCLLPRSSRLLSNQLARQWPRQPCQRNLVSAASIQFGQPLHETHPHLLRPGEREKEIPASADGLEARLTDVLLTVTPGITAFEYAERRAKLAASLPPNSVAILAASDTKYRSGAVFYKFHQDPNFLYLTGMQLDLRTHYVADFVL